MAESITFDNLVKTFGAIRAVDHVTIKIEPGELFFLLGPSGCGKTTLLRCIAGFYEPDSGAVWMGKKDISRLPPHQRDTGMVFQSYALWPHLTVTQNVAFGLEMRNFSRSEIDQRVEEVLETVKMSDRADYKPNQLSGGQQQRVALARALVIHPKCLLLDEPLSNLDAKLRLEMRAEIRRICKDAGLTAIYVTHDQKEALSIADRLAVLHEGRVQQLGAPQDVYRNPANSFVANFIGETNFLKAEVLEQKDGGVTVVKTPLGTIVSSASGDVKPGDHVTLSIRPEAIRLYNAPRDVPNVFDGQIHHTMYLGEVAQHRVSLPAFGRKEGDGSLELKSFELNPRVVARDHAEQAQVWIDPSDVVMLKE